LLAVIVGFNLANLSLFFSALPGPEAMLAGQSALLVTLILVQTVITLWAVWWAADHRPWRWTKPVDRFAFDQGYVTKGYVHLWSWTKPWRNC
jgi:hypothetical protein